MHYVIHGGIVLTVAVALFAKMLKGKFEELVI